MRLIASSLMAGLIAATAVAPAFADPPRGKGHGGWDDHRGKGKGHGWKDDRGWNDDRGGWKGNDRGWHDGYRDDRWGGRGWYDTRGSHHDWRRGDYFRYRPSYSNFVVVHDYNYYRLPPPRHGHYYYRDRDTGEILLVAAATGLILWALTN